MELTLVEAGSARSTVESSSSSLALPRLIFRDALLFRTDADGFDGSVGISHPVVERLSQEGDAGHEEEHQTFVFEFLFDEFERGESFARATRHNEFTAVVVLEVQMRCFEGFTLMRSELFFASQSRLAF